MNIHKKISDQSAFIAIMIIGLMIAFVTIRIGEKIVQGSESSAFEKNQQIEKELDKI
ncbi:MAG: hypothetical protein WC238_01450 [Parcubacteria group bacterium]